jgi:carbonic anhydrase
LALIEFLDRGNKMSFYTAINCMDGRVQLPVINYLSSRFKAEHIDSITEAGPVLYLAERAGSEQTKSILRRTEISINKHKSKGIAVIAHHDCAGNPADDCIQISQLPPAVNFLADLYPNTEIIGLWLDSSFSVKEICSTSNTHIPAK